MKIENLKIQLEELKKEVKERDPKGWKDYDWCIGKGDFTKGKINILEQILEDDKS